MGCRAVTVSDEKGGIGEWEPTSLITSSGEVFVSLRGGADACKVSGVSRS